MKLDRNHIGAGGGKYGLIKNRELHAAVLKANEGADGVEAAAAVIQAIVVLEQAGIIDWGTTPDAEFFAIRLKDKYAATALFAYSASAHIDDPEYAGEVYELALRAGPNHRNCKRPD